MWPERGDNMADNGNQSDDGLGRLNARNLTTCLRPDPLCSTKVSGNPAQVNVGVRMLTLR